MIFKNKVFDALKWITLIALPAIATAYATLANGLGLPYSDEVSLIVNVACTLLGTLLGISNYQYYKGKSEDVGEG